MEESKQNRKNPLTTIGINQDAAQELDQLLAEKYPGMKRKEFVESAIAYFKRTGYDLTSYQVDYTPIERLAKRLERSTSIIEEENAGRSEMKKLLLAMQQKQLSLPSAEDIEAATSAKTEAETRLKECMKRTEELKVVDAENNRLRIEIDRLKNKLSIATEELERCANSLLSKPSKTIIKDLKSNI